MLAQGAESLQVAPAAGAFTLQDSWGKRQLLLPSANGYQAQFTTDSAPSLQNASSMPAPSWNFDSQTEVEFWHYAPNGKDLVAGVRSDSAYEVLWIQPGQQDPPWTSLLSLPSWTYDVEAQFSGEGTHIGVLLLKRNFLVWKLADVKQGAQPDTLTPKRIEHPSTRLASAFRNVTLPGNPLASVYSPHFYNPEYLRTGTSPGHFQLQHGDEVAELRYTKAGLELAGKPQKADSDSIVFYQRAPHTYTLEKDHRDGGFLLRHFRKAKATDNELHLAKFDKAGMHSRGIWVRSEQPETRWQFYDAEFHTIQHPLQSFLQANSSLPKMLALYASPTQDWGLVQNGDSLQVYDWSKGNLRTPVQKTPLPTQGGPTPAMVQFSHDGSQLLVAMALPEQNAIAIYRGKARTHAQGVQLAWTECARLGGIYSLIAAFDSNNTHLAFWTSHGDLWIAPIQEACKD